MKREAVNIANENEARETQLPWICASARKEQKDAWYESLPLSCAHHNDVAKVSAVDKF